MLQNVAGQKYTYNQITALKQFYYNKNIYGKPKWKSLLDWSVDYKVKKNYVWSIKDGLEQPIAKKCRICYTNTDFCRK